MHPSLFLILATAFLDILGLSLVIPLLPTIIEGFGVMPSWTGYTQAVYALGMFVGGLIFGRLSDRYGRKNILSFTSIINLVSYIIMFLSLTFLWSRLDGLSGIHTGGEVHLIDISHLSLLFEGFTPLFVLFLLARFVGGLWGAGFGVIQAYISDISPKEEKTKNMGLIGAAFGLAFLIGPALGGLLSSIIAIPHIILLCAGIIFINVLSIIFFLKEPKKQLESHDGDEVSFHFSWPVILLLFLSFSVTLAFAAIQSMSTQFYADRFSFSATMIGVTMAVVGLVAILYQGFAVKYVRQRFDEHQMIRGALALLIFGFLGFSLNMSPYFLFFWIIFFPLGMGSIQPSISSLIAQKAGREVGKVMGYNTSIQSIWQIVWPILAGVLYYTAGTALPFFVSTGIFVFLLLLVLFLDRSK